MDEIECSFIDVERQPGKRRKSHAQTVRAIVVDPSRPEGLAVKPVELAPANPDEATVRVTAISLNRGEVRRATSQGKPGDRPGWDFAGVVEARAANGTGPALGSRVVGLLPSGAWAERVQVPSHAVAALPEAVTDAQAASLPVAGLTALHALRQGGLRVGVRQAQFRAAIAEWCGERIVLGADLKAAAPHRPFHLILDSVGGTALAAALTMLAPGGTCVTFGVSESATSTIASRDFFGTGGVKLYGLYLFHELRRVEPAAGGLALLAWLVARRVLQPHIAVEAPWTEIGPIARQLLDRAFAGKAVMHLG